MINLDYSIFKVYVKLNKKHEYVTSVIIIPYG